MADESIPPLQQFQLLVQDRFADGAWDAGDLAAVEESYNKLEAFEQRAAASYVTMYLGQEGRLVSTIGPLDCGLKLWGSVESLCPKGGKGNPSMLQAVSIVGESPLSVVEVRAALNRRTSGIEKAYQSELVADPNLGEVKLDFSVIIPADRVYYSEVTLTSPPDHRPAVQRLIETCKGELRWLRVSLGEGEPRETEVRVSLALPRVGKTQSLAARTSVALESFIMKDGIREAMTAQYVFDKALPVLNEAFTVASQQHGTTLGGEFKFRLSIDKGGKVEKAKAVMLDPSYTVSAPEVRREKGNILKKFNAVLEELTFPPSSERSTIEIFFVFNQNDQLASSQ